jgi:hypothetical protein
MKRQLEEDVEQGGVEDAAAAAAAGENINNEDASSSLLNKESVDPEGNASFCSVKLTGKREDPPGILPVDVNIAEPKSNQALIFSVMLCCSALSGGVRLIYEILWGGGRPENDNT